MVNYTNVIEVGLGMIELIAVGFILAKCKIVNEKMTAPLNRWCFRCCFICLAARSIIGKDLTTLDFRPFAISALMAVAQYIFMLLVFLFPIEDKFGTYLASALPVCYINYIISGLPVFNAIWPPEENAMVSLMLLPNDLVASPLFMLLVGFYKINQENKERIKNGQEKAKWTWPMVKSIIMRVITHPILDGNIIGLIYAACLRGFKVPTTVTMVLNFAADCSLPFSLFCVGVFLASHSLLSCHWLQFIGCMITRCFIGPIFAAIFCYAMGLSPRLSRQCTIIAAQPTAVASYVMSAETGVGAGVSSTMILWSTVLSVPVAIVWMVTLDALNIFVE